MSTPRPHLTALLAITMVTAFLAAPARASQVPATTGDPSSAWQDAQQMVVVTIPQWTSTHGTLHTYARDRGGDWQPVGQPSPVVIGRGGAGWGLGLQPPRHDGPVKKEGDGRSPAGVFRIGTAFGYASRADTGLAYRGMTAADWCVDVDGSPYYNRIVDAGKVGRDAVKGSSEPMRRDLHVHGDQRYRQGFVIESNWQQRPTAGSCIFGHLWASPDTSTAGCTAMAPQTMQTLLHWLDADRHPVLVLLPGKTYAEVRQAWHLPRLDAPATP